MSVVTSASSGRIGNVAYNDIMSETRRRQRAAVTGGASTLDNDTEYTRPFKTDDQNVFLWTTANTNSNIKSLRPAFCLLGLFASVEEASSHGRRIIETDNPCFAIRISSTHEWYSIPVDAFLETTAIEPHQAKTNRNLLKHQYMLQASADEFKSRKDRLTAGRTPATRQAEEAEKQTSMRLEKINQRHTGEAYSKRDVDIALKEIRDNMEWSSEAQDRIKKNESYNEVLQRSREEGVDVEDDGVEESKGGGGDDDDDGVEESKEEGGSEDNNKEKEELIFPRIVPPEVLDEDWESQINAQFNGQSNLIKVRPMSRAVEVRNQRYAVVSVLQDYEDGNEPSICVWAAFDTEEEALKYNKCVASKHVSDHDLAIVSMYEWLYPHVMTSDAVDQLYRNEELNNIMKNARNSSKRVRDFERECTDHGRAVPTIEVASDLEAPAPTRYCTPVGFDPTDTSFEP